MRDVDDRTVAYIMAAQPCFEDLKQVAAQLAGLLVLQASGSKSVTPDHPMVAAAGQAYRSAVDGLRGARVSARAQIHHGHLLKAATYLGAALTSVRSGLDAVAQIEAAYEELRSASGTLPGFQMISFDRGCCAA